MPELAKTISSARALYQQGQLLLAEQQLRVLIAEDPQDIDASLLLGIILVRTKRLEPASATLATVLEKEPDRFDALNWMALCKKDQGLFEESISFAKHATNLQPQNPAAYNTLGLAFLELKQYEKAIYAIGKAVELNPKSGPTIHNLGRAFAAAYRQNEALAAFETAAQLNPTQVSNYVEIYRQCELLGAWDRANTWLGIGLQHQPESVPILIALAKTKAELNDAVAAEQLFRRARRIDPKTSQAYALWLQQTGRFEDSVELLLESIRIQPKQGLAYYYLAEARAFDQPNGSLIESARSIQEAEDLDPNSRMFLFYAMAKAHDRFGEHGEAMRAYDQANGLAHQLFNTGRPYNQEKIRQFEMASERLFNREFLREYRKFGSDSSQPIFIVGMIRSGTTLVDQIISSHPAVETAGEQPFWSQFTEATVNGWLKDKVDPKRIQSLAHDYLDLLHRTAGNHERITDKMPINFDYLGLILTVFPNAKVVHMRRNPIDTCLSIYMTHFGVGPSFAYSKRNIVDHYRHYLATIDHWRNLLSREILIEVNYEELIANQESCTRDLIASLGLPWDDACLSHEKSSSTILTPSRWQARQPIYRTSENRWKKYEPWLGELLELRDVSHPPISS
jgi:tetratricopeptide (TPR) repeat protein